MNFYKLDYTIEKVRQNDPSREQKILLELAGETFQKREAEILWEKIQDHKWYVSERLKRDIGFRVAAVDYIENFYEPFFFGKRKTNFKDSVSEFFKIISRTEFLRPKSL
jgi:hypothetical protein